MFKVHFKAIKNKSEKKSCEKYELITIETVVIH